MWCGRSPARSPTLLGAAERIALGVFVFCFLRQMSPDLRQISRHHIAKMGYGACPGHRPHSEPKRRVGDGGPHAIILMPLTCQGLCSEVAQRARQAQPGCAEQPRPRHYGAACRLPEARPLQDLQKVNCVLMWYCDVVSWFIICACSLVHCKCTYTYICAPAWRARAARRGVPPQGSRQGSAPPVSMSMCGVCTCI